jgi:hypothetical protein
MDNIVVVGARRSALSALWESGHPNIVVLDDAEKAVENLNAMEGGNNDFGIYLPSVDGDKMVVVACEMVLAQHQLREPEPFAIKAPLDFNLPEMKMIDNAKNRNKTGGRKKVPYKKRNDFF